MRCASTRYRVLVTLAYGNQFFRLSMSFGHAVQGIHVSILASNHLQNCFGKGVKTHTLQPCCESRAFKSGSHKLSCGISSPCIIAKSITSLVCRCACYQARAEENKARQPARKYSIGRIERGRERILTYFRGMSTFAFRF